MECDMITITFTYDKYKLHTVLVTGVARETRGTYPSGAQGSLPPC